ncbi:coiled-coil-helix-coiled-coil-helix domain containing 6b isoform X2 [Pimephales promelas]|uniref:coiled-coil-helix-coiled-coil-helix domain containing 6b isoform X2 n=1 Tax=Pimephales promelas TaxID=90988 RepID=UPI001955C2EF|nr:coiled-coil-helix-coiled-coil-helix domain containing 6b isoform X2 [Pimephales promelas]KAG1934168.1 MICOS complex subunit MIC25 [Pimephales promelas]
MGAADSRSGSVSYGLDEQDSVTVLQGVKLSGNVLQRMRESGSCPGKPASPKPERDTPNPGASRPSAGETPGELRRRYEREQALVQEELTRIARRERETAMGDDMRERANTHPDLQKTHTLARQLKKKEDELKHLEQFYKEQLQLMEKKNTDFYQQTLHMYTQEAVKAEAAVKPGHVTPVCAELQSQVLSCYTLNKRHTLLCSQLARDYMHCIHSCKKNLLVNHG